MEPKFHTGDLAIVKPVNRYRVGDIAVYQSRTLHTLVMHRIVGREGAHYVFKGDNNSWTDKDRPTARRPRRHALARGPPRRRGARRRAPLLDVHPPGRAAVAVRDLRLDRAPEGSAPARGAQPRRRGLRHYVDEASPNTFALGAARRRRRPRVHTARDGRAIDADPGLSIRAARPGDGAAGTRRRARRRAPRAGGPSGCASSGPSSSRRA